MIKAHSVLTTGFYKDLVTTTIRRVRISRSPPLSKKQITTTLKSTNSFSRPLKHFKTTVLFLSILC